MITSNLKKEIESFLEKADELWFAVALVKDSTFEYIQNKISQDCIQHHLVGIDLPTPPSVLRTMQSKEKKGVFECAIYKSRRNFHPKVYLMRYKDQYVAFIGSSNLTDGGYENNIELSYKVSNQSDCINILNWFDSLFKDGFPLTKENIDDYESYLELIKDFEEEIKRRRKSISLKKPNQISNLLDGIDFRDKYFKKKHHWAFRKELWYSDSKEAINERELAQIKFLELHEKISPQFKDYGIETLEPNPMSDHLISMIRQIDPTKPRAIKAMWLSYGKNGDEIKEYQKIVGRDQKAKQTFIHHARMQIRIDIKKIGILMLFAKENEGGLFDRAFFKEQMRGIEYREHFYSMIRTLQDDYYISVGGERKDCNSFNSPRELHDFCKKDDIHKYFIIGKDYNITDEGL